MKKYLSRFLFAVAFLASQAILTLPLYAAEIGLSTKASNFGFDDDGSLNPDVPRFGLSASVSDRISNRLDGRVYFDRDPMIGNIMGARASYHTSFLEISAGPSFGLLNSDGGSHDVKVLFQPGIGIGFKIVIPGYFLASADTDFAMPPATWTNGQSFIQRGELSLGFYLPNVLCTAKVSQRNNTTAYLAGDVVRSVTDWGFYTEAYKKGSPFRISVDFIYRIQNFIPEGATAEPVKVGNLMLGTGVTWSPSADMGFFVKMNSALYSFTLNEKVNDLDKYLYEFSLGARVVTASPKGID